MKVKVEVEIFSDPTRCGAGREECKFINNVNPLLKFCSLFKVILDRTEGGSAIKDKRCLMEMRNA